MLRACSVTGRSLNLVFDESLLKDDTILVTQQATPRALRRRRPRRKPRSAAPRICLPPTPAPLPLPTLVFLATSAANDGTIPIFGPWEMCARLDWCQHPAQADSALGWCTDGRCGIGSLPNMDMFSPWL